MRLQHFRKKNSRLVEGFAIIETMIALSIITIGFYALVTLVNQALAISRTVADDFTGTYLAAEGIEVVKNLIDYNSNAAISLGTACPFTGGGSGCFPATEGCYEVNYDTDMSNFPLPVDPSPNCDPIILAEVFSNNANVPVIAHTLAYDGTFFSYNGAAPGATPYHRIVKIQLNPNNSDEIQVNSVVAWLGRGNTQVANQVINLEAHFLNWRD